MSSNVIRSAIAQYNSGVTPEIKRQGLVTIARYLGMGESLPENIKIPALLDLERAIHKEKKTPAEALKDIDPKAAETITFVSQLKEQAAAAAASHGR